MEGELLGGGLTALAAAAVVPLGLHQPLQVREALQAIYREGGGGWGGDGEDPVMTTTTHTHTHTIFPAQTRTPHRI